MKSLVYGCTQVRRMHTHASLHLVRALAQTASAGLRAVCTILFDATALHLGAGSTSSPVASRYESTPAVFTQAHMPQSTHTVPPALIMRRLHATQTMSLVPGTIGCASPRPSQMHWPGAPTSSGGMHSGQCFIGAHVHTDCIGSTRSRRTIRRRTGPLAARSFQRCSLDTGREDSMWSTRRGFRRYSPCHRRSRSYPLRSTSSMWIRSWRSTQMRRARRSGCITYISGPTNLNASPSWSS